MLKGFKIYFLILSIFIVSPIFASKIVGVGIIKSSRSIELIIPIIRRARELNVVTLVPQGEYVKKGQIISTFKSSELEKREYELKNWVLRQKEASLLAIKKIESRISQAKLDIELRKNVHKRKKIEAQKSSYAFSKRRLKIKKLDVEVALARYNSALTQLKLLEELKLKIIEFADILKTKTQGKLNRVSLTLRSRLLVKAPEDGLLIHNEIYHSGKWQKVEVGNSVYRGSPIARIIDPKQLFVDVIFSENDFSTVKLNQRVKIHLTSDLNKNLEGTIESLQGFIQEKKQIIANQSLPDWDKKVFRAKVKIDNIPHWLKPRMSVEVTIL